MPVDRAETLKTAGKDMCKHRLTLALIHLLGSVDEKNKDAVINSYSGRKDLQYDKGALVNMLKRYGSLEYVRARAQEFVNDSVMALATLKESEARDALIQTVKFMACSKT